MTIHKYLQQLAIFALNMATIALLKNLIGLFYKTNMDMNYDMDDTTLWDSSILTKTWDYSALQDGAVGGADPSRIALDHSYDLDDPIAVHM